MRALVAPSEAAVCPTSRTIRNFDRSHVDAAGFKAEGFKAAGRRAASFTGRGFGEAAGFAKAAGFEVAGFEVAGFGEAACVGDLCFDGPLNISDSQPASLTSIGRSANAAIAAMMTRQRGQTPKPERANFLPDDSNPYFPYRDFQFALHDNGIRRH